MFLAFVLGVALLALGSGTAGARPTPDGARVTYTWCGQGVVELEYFDQRGDDFYKEVVNMRGGCREYSYVSTPPNATYAAAFITDERGGPVMCTLRVNGVLIDREKRPANGYYTWVSCS